MSKEKAVLSVVVISHNQKDKLRRCVESILQQETDFPIEVIVSDDNSTDGTREMLLEDYHERVVSTFFNSNEFETSFVLQRAALNRINGLKSATGKYLIHIDGDDYFTSTDVFQLMVDKLEAHPECSLCCQNFYIKPEDKLDEHFQPYSKSKHFELESVLTANEFISQIGLLHNSCFCARRTAHVKIEDLTSKTYDDGDITIRYLGNGCVAFVNRCDFVYVKYNGSSCSTISETDKKVIFSGAICGIPLNPWITGSILRKKAYLKDIINISRMAIFRCHFSDGLIKYFSDFDMFLLKNLSNNMPLNIWWHYLKIFTLSSFVYLFNLNYNHIYKSLYRLVVKPEISNQVVL